MSNCMGVAASASSLRAASPSSNGSLGDPPDSRSAQLLPAAIARPPSKSAARAVREQIEKLCLLSLVCIANDTWH